MMRTITNIRTAAGKDAYRHGKIAWGLLLLLLLSSCHQEKVVFITTTQDNYYLIQNPPKDIKALRDTIVGFIRAMRQPAGAVDSYFYRYSSGTAYFIKNKPDPGGHFSEDLDFYEEDKIASFGMEPCPADSTKQLALLRFFNQWGNYYQPDTLFNNCKTANKR